MIRALIADDEPLSRRAVQQLLARHADITVVAECADGATAREAIATLEPDVIFLDVRMPLATGIEVARTSSTGAGGPLVVFVTAYEQFALPAFDVAAVDYLTKPLVEERFDLAVDRLRERLRERGDGTHSYVRHLLARIGAREIVIPVDTIDFIEADDVYASVSVQGKRHLVRSSLDALERALDPLVFGRVHRSYLVRLTRITELRRGEGGLVAVCIGDAMLPVSRRRRAVVEEFVARHKLG